MIKEFVKFLKEYKIVSLAVAFIMGEASSGLVNSLVKDFFMPLIAPLLSAESWQEASFNIGPISIAYGTLLADIINFVIIIFFIFIIARKLLAMEAKIKK